MVFYRKYRPQTISELDLESVRTRLTSILKASEIPHAFLFTGPKGLGKTSSARILAKAINCQLKQVTSDKLRVTKTSQMSNVTHSTSSGREGPADAKVLAGKQLSDIEPCNKCDACTSITNGSNIDVLEIDAASNRGIDEIRDLREKVKFAPSNLTRKVYIIDEVHMLTSDAFNALLKTLEEPPSHVVFILCTTEIEKVPPTIISRAFHVSFHKPTESEIVGSIARIVKGEKLEIEDQVFPEIVRLSEGSFRDAAKILEDLAIATEGKKITKETLETTYKTHGSDAAVKELLVALSKKDFSSSMKILEDLANAGADFKVLTERLAQTIHGILLSRAKIEEAPYDTEEFETHELKELLSMINSSYKDIKFSVLPQIPLELVVMEWTSMITVHSSQITDRKKTDGADSIDAGVVADKQEEKEEIKDESGHGVLFDKDAKPENFMSAFIVRVKQDNHSIAGILRGCRLVEINQDSVVFETKYKFHKDKLNETKTSTILDKRASELLKEEVRVVVNLVVE